MPPKKVAGKKNEPSKKTVEKQKDRVIEDKTFGLKNKKGKKQQQFVKTFTQQVKFGNKSAQKIEQEKAEAKAKKTASRRDQDELNALFRPSQTLSKGTDPKSVLCAFFKQGTCTKGDKCKFSHDMGVERKSEKRSLYFDKRDNDLEKDTMDTWDQAKLEAVVEKKHGDGASAGPQIRTEIVCKFFLEAVEKGLYGWFWHCPNGEKCIYRHALPPGFVLKREKKAMEDQKEDSITLEELIEDERAKLSARPKLTPVTLQTFMEWKKKKVSQKKEKAAKALAKKKSDFRQGKLLGVSGREVFAFNPDLVDEDDDGDTDVVYFRRQDIDEDETGDVAGGVEAIDLTNMGFAPDDGLLDMACAVVREDDVSGGMEVDGVEIDEELFAAAAGDLDFEDLDDSDSDNDGDDVSSEDASSS
eukprot:m.309208 g.309208  ORF g.309208 m.309208 type:complete len:414 (+) comp45790_c0_seq1:35-1276(+)